MAARGVDLGKLQPSPKEIADAKKLIAELKWLQLQMPWLPLASFPEKGRHK